MQICWLFGSQEVFDCSSRCIVSCSDVLCAFLLSLHLAVHSCPTAPLVCGFCVTAIAYDLGLGGFECLRTTNSVSTDGIALGAGFVLWPTAPPWNDAKSMACYL